jgi:hypothetical protein
MNKLDLVEFWVMIIWSIVMIPLGFYAVIKGHDVPMGLATCYCGALGSYAVKVTFKGQTGGSNANTNGNSN